jgi:non-specific serine/threonine protein kinase
MTRAAGNLPVCITRFVGRREELGEVRRLLGAARLVSLTGPGGVGKTRLALEAAAASAKAFPGGVWLVDLAPVREASAVPGVVAAALNVADAGPRPVTELLVAHLSKRRVLLVLDNCEHLVEACAHLAQQLLSAAPELRILATSRETLQVTGEHVLPVTVLPQRDAVELLRQRTAAVRPGFEVTDANKAPVIRLCEDLDGLPLALELAASRLRTLTVEQVVERLEDRFALLTTGSRTARPHQRTLRAAMDWSWELCDPAERLLWARLSVFAGSFTLEAAEQVCTGDGIDAREAADLLDRLVAQSLVKRIEVGGATRYRLLETIRQYGRERLTAFPGEETRARRRHRGFYLELAESLFQIWFGPRQAEILTRLRAEHANLLAALEYRAAACPATPGAADPECGKDDALRAVDRQARLALCGALLYHWVAGGFLGEGRRQLERSLAAAPEPTTVRGRALVAAAYVAQTQYDLEAADAWLTECEELARRLGEPVLGAQARGHRGISALYRGRLEEAVTCLEEAVADHSALGDRFGEVTWRCALAIVHAVAADPRAERTSARALTETQAHGERWARAHLLMMLGRRAWTRGDQREAEALTVSALETLRGFNDTVGVAKMVEQLAWVTASAGHCRRAAGLLGAARALRDDAGTTVATGDPQDERYHARCQAEARTALGQTGLERAMAEGAAVDGPEHAIAYAVAPEDMTARAAPPAEPRPLTRREEQVAALVAQGMTNRRIAAELVLSPRTVDNHVERIRSKLGFSSRTQIATWWTAEQVPVA